MPSSVSAARSPTLFFALVCLAVPLAAFLGFSVQAMVAKALVPRQGGTAATWMGTTLFFQCALLGGYAGAYALLRRPLRTQLVVWSILLAAAVLTLRLPPWDLGAQGLAGTVLALGASLLPAALALFATSILLQGWQARHQIEIPYVLYAFSNVGSLAGLVLYPFAVEPHIGLGTQFAVWRGGLVLLALCFGCLVFLLHRNPGREAPTQADEFEASRGARLRFFGWLALAALPCVAMLGAAQLLSAEIGSNPVAWVVPLGIYLASFALTFSGWWSQAATRLAGVVCLIGWIGFSLTKGVGDAPLRGWPLIWLLVALIGACHSAHGWLYSLRPARDFSRFYLALAIGGAAGGVFANILAPGLLDRPDEAWWAMGLVAAALCASTAASGLLTRLLAATPILALMAGVAFFADAPPGGTKVHHLRNVYGSVTVKMSTDRITLSHETTLHGAQLTLSPAARRAPTTYYTPSSGAGVVIRHLQAGRPALRVAVIGLGTGTLATYARPSDTFVFWDVDPKIIWLAENLFTFLKDSEGACEVRLADGRRGLAESSGDFDLVIVDAFSGDAIPPHLLTREAFALYQEKTLRKDGLVLLHVSNRFANLQPVATATAASLGLETLQVNNEVVHRTPDGDVLATPTRYLVLHPPARRDEIDALFAETDDTRARLRRGVSRIAADAPGARLWTDDRHAITDVIDFRLFWSGEARP